MIVWMHRAPLWVVMVVCATAAGLLLVGAVAHVTDLLHHGLQAYDWAPRWLNLYWSSLALLDLLAAALLISGKRRGTELVCAIMATDLAANWYAIYGIQHSDLAAQPGLQRLLGFSVFVLGTAPFVRRHLS
ncbi:hypothetical protein [Streptomyces sp. SP18CS02]|uniref:hypothetical protein n=1 Tax=Streptomyces sp. SP18CS02 TaxID=3002531 RepID=UPI002E799F18|nr:hypothetical protein [Streptomyces sp. SP18CS02]MEE1752896.1 hypothetical protein [Streptomyces sp. SP18CS02]